MNISGKDTVACDLLAHQLQAVGRVRLRAVGSSMIPTIWPGDEVILERISSDVSVGEIVAYNREERLFIHRIIGTSAKNVTTQGDRLSDKDAPVRRSELLGRVESVIHRGRSCTPGRRPTLAARFVRSLSRVSDRPVLWLARLLQ